MVCRTSILTRARFLMVSFFCPRRAFFFIGQKPSQRQHLHSDLEIQLLLLVRIKPPTNTACQKLERIAHSQHPSFCPPHIFHQDGQTYPSQLQPPNFGVMLRVGPCTALNDIRSSRLLLDASNAFCRS